MALPNGTLLAVLCRCMPVTCYTHEMTFKNRRDFRTHIKEMHDDFVFRR
jgi:hypothetical protein